MNIGLYGEPTNLELLKYKGLYRQNNLIDFYYNNVFESYIEWYFSISTEGNYIQYTKENEIRVIFLYKILKAENWYGDIILFTDNIDTAISTDYELIGYDVCADSKYYSPIGDGFLESYDTDNVFFFEMNKNDYQNYKNNINDYGLFSSYDTALIFSSYCNKINNKYKHAVETEKNWRPFAIYRRRQYNTE